MKVFLGGTWNNSTWRERLIPQLNIPYFNPIVEDWTFEAQAQEVYQKILCDIHLYVITPLMTGVYSIAEVVDDSHNRDITTVFTALREDDGKRFSDSQWSSLEAVMALVHNNGGVVLHSLEETVEFVNYPCLKAGACSVAKPSCEA